MFTAGVRGIAGKNALEVEVFASGAGERTLVTSQKAPLKDVMGKRSTVSVQRAPNMNEDLQVGVLEEVKKNLTYEAVVAKPRGKTPN